MPHTFPLSTARRKQNEFVYRVNKKMLLFTFLNS
nr:MAG TPA: hypothetical protein [Bacteriophage sp.]